MVNPPFFHLLWPVQWGQMRWVITLKAGNFVCLPADSHPTSDGPI